MYKRKSFWERIIILSKSLTECYCKISKLDIASNDWIICAIMLFEFKCPFQCTWSIYCCVKINQLFYIS